MSKTEKNIQNNKICNEANLQPYYFKTISKFQQLIDYDIAGKMLP